MDGGGYPSIPGLLFRGLIEMRAGTPLGDRDRQTM